MLLVKSTSDSPVLNGGVEKKYLTEHSVPDVLLFYINRPAVIVGRNQLIEAEANIAYCQQHNIEIYKRISGGGTVYHDYGNINYAFISTKRKIPMLEMDFATPIINALQSVGINATRGERKELLVDNKKISGTASHITRDHILFHGTLLHHTDLTHLHNALQGNQTLRSRKNVASIYSPVINMAEIIKTNDSTQTFLEKILCFFEAYYRTKTIEYSFS